MYYNIVMPKELFPYQENNEEINGNSLEEALDCGQRVMLSAYDLAKTLGVLPGETVVPLRPDEIDNAEIVYNKMQDPNREYYGEDWKSLPTDWESPYVPVTKDMAQKVREFSATCRGESSRGDATEREIKAVKVSIGRYVMRGVDTVPNEPYPDIILDVECNSAGLCSGVRLHGVKTETGDYAFKRPVIVYIDGESALEYEDPLPDGTLETLAEIIEYVNDGTWKNEQEYLRVEQILGKEESWESRTADGKTKSFYVGDVLQFLSGRALVPRRNGSDNMDMMLQITDYVTDDPHTSTLTGSVRIFNEVKEFLLENEEIAQLLKSSGAETVKISSVPEMAEYLRGIIDQYGKTHITLEKMPEGRHVVIKRYIEELIEAGLRGKGIIRPGDEK